MRFDLASLIKSLHPTKSEVEAENCQPMNLNLGHEEGVKGVIESVANLYQFNSLMKTFASFGGCNPLTYQSSESYPTSINTCSNIATRPLLLTEKMS